MMKKRGRFGRVLGGGADGRGRIPEGGGRNPGPPKALKSKKITKHKSTSDLTKRD